MNRSLRKLNFKFTSCLLVLILVALIFSRKSEIVIKPPVVEMETVESSSLFSMPCYVMTTGGKIHVSLGSCHKIFNNLTHLTLNDLHYVRKNMMLSAENYKEDYINSLRLIASYEKEYFILLEDDAKLCFDDKIVHKIIYNNGRKVYQLSYGTVAMSYHSSVIGEVIKSIEKSDLPVDNALGMNYPVSKTKIPLFVEDKSIRDSTLGHHSKGGKCNQFCVDSSLINYETKDNKDLYPTLDSTMELPQYVYYERHPACSDWDSEWLIHNYSWSGIDMFSKDHLLNKENVFNYKLEGKIQLVFYTIWFGPINKYSVILNHNCEKLSHVIIYTDASSDIKPNNCIKVVFFSVSKLIRDYVKDNVDGPILENNFNKGERTAMTHVSDIARLLFSEPGHIYFDMDFIFVNPELYMDTLQKPFIVLNKRLYDQNYYIPNGFFHLWAEDRNNLLNMVSIHYNYNCWDCVGPLLFKLYFPGVVDRYRVLDWSLFGSQKVETHEMMYENVHDPTIQLMKSYLKTVMMFHVGNLYIDRLQDLMNCKSAICWVIKKTSN